MAEDDWLHRADSSYPYQDWKPFPNGTYVEIKNDYGSKKGYVEEFWWGYDRNDIESVIMSCRKAEPLRLEDTHQIVKTEYLDGVIIKYVKEKETKQLPVREPEPQNERLYVICCVSVETKLNTCKFFPHVYGVYDSFDDADDVRKGLTDPDQYTIISTFKG